MAGFFFVLLPTNGDYVGLVLAQLWLIFIIVLGDRFFLSSLKAKKVGAGHKLAQKIDNFRALRRFENRIEIFNSKELNDNVLIIDSYLRPPAIVVGNKLVTQLREEDLDRILSLSIERLEASKWKYACVITQLLSIIALPLVLLTIHRKTYVLNSLFSAPAMLLTQVFWKIGVVKIKNEDVLKQLRDSYPALWSSAKPRTNKHLNVFLTYVLDYFLLIQTEQSNLSNHSFQLSSQVVAGKP